jgi:signal transduction histidine kinase/CheY-like chemotaxis protein
VEETLSRELSLRCDREGSVTWVDARATRLLGVSVGTDLKALAAPGSDAKVERLLSGTSGDSAWEVVLLREQKPATFAFRTAQVEDSTGKGELLLVGSLVPDDYGRSLGEAAAMMSELATLHRDTERQQRELLRRNEDLVRLNRELEESSRGMIALHAELDEKGDSLRRASEVKSHLIANVSHEFRTPLNSILGLSKLLLDRLDGDLTDEQEKQLGFIRKSAETLTEMVDDLLDLSKIEAGKVGFRPVEFDVHGTFAALRGMLRPLRKSDKVALVFEAAPDLPQLDTDEGKVSQILRNLISNALKFTESGSVMVSASMDGEHRARQEVVFRVRDTGIGIDPADQEKVFEEFVQIDGPLQRTLKGTGLGLSLCRRLADILGGTLTLESEPGRGSTFALTIPRVHPEVKEMSELAERSQRIEPGNAPVLVVEDDRQTLFLYERYLRGSGFQVIPARSIDDARAAMARIEPAAIVLDVMLDGEASWAFLAELKSSPRTRDIPTLVVTVTDREEKARALGADEFYVKPLDQRWLVTKLQSLSHASPVESVLVIDDDEIARYMVKKLLAGTPYRILEAASGAEGIRVAHDQQPGVIFLDFVMPGMSAFDVIDELKRDPVTRDIPVIIHTSKKLAEEEKRRLAADAAAVVSKQSLSREVAIHRIREALVKHGIGSSARPPSPAQPRNGGER